MEFTRKYIVTRNRVVDAFFNWRKDAEDYMEESKKRHRYDHYEVYVKLNKGESIDKAREQS